MPCPADNHPQGRGPRTTLVPTLGVVALAPWFPPDLPVSPLADRRLAVAHGRSDRITSYAAARHFVERAARVAQAAYFQDMGPVGHYMLRDASAWNAFAQGRCLGMLDDR